MENNKEIKQIIAENIVFLRKSKKWTQAELAERLNFSDKAISKWERAESTPDVDSLAAIASLFGVTVDYLFHEVNEEKEKYVLPTDNQMRNYLLVLSLIGLSFMLIAVVILVAGYYKDPATLATNWIGFIYCIPGWAFLGYLFFMKYDVFKPGKTICSSVFIWFLLLGIYLSLLFSNNNVWLIFLIGVPLELAVVLIYFIRGKNK